MEYCVERFENEKYRLSIYQDDFMESPREFNSNFGKMICWHRDYSLGDSHNYTDAEDFFRTLASDLGIETTTEIYDEEYEEYEEVDIDIELIIEKVEKEIIILPLYLYDHSGISMRSYRFGYHSSWDCGEVGYIYVTNEDIIKEYGVLNDENKKMAINLLECEISTYSQYLEGDVYLYLLEEKKLCEHCQHMEYEQIDCCGGFYGYDLQTNGILEQVNLSMEELQELIKEENKKVA